jgi:3-phosphoshikimate 1-carboxyvinyltransferase
MQFQVKPSVVGSATVRVPGDKSISHRALMFGSIATGTTEISGFLAGEDCLATLTAMRALGVEIEAKAATEVTVKGVGLQGLRPSGHALDLGNSGTAMRLMAGLLSAQSFDSVLTGDPSLTGRPMRRVIDPLQRMGARIHSSDGCPPLRINGNPSLRAIEYELPIASAQVKSAILIAGLYAEGSTCVIEPAVTRDHTERMLQSMGADMEVVEDRRISIRGGRELQGRSIRVPADLSSAAFVILAAVLAEDANVLIENVGVNPTRTGVIDILQQMGADISMENPRMLGEEPIADIRVRSSQLQGGPVDPDLVSLAIDEFPVLFVAAAAAAGETVFSGIAELRVKESDRIKAMADGLRILGVRVEESLDGAVVHGGTIGGGTVESQGDHRIAMSLAVAGSIARGPVTVRNVAAVDTSFPGFSACLRSIGIDVEAERGAPV